MFMLLGKSISAAFLLLLILEMVGWKEKEKHERRNVSKVKRPVGDIERVIDVRENKQVNIINIVSIGKSISGQQKRYFDQQDRTSKEVETENKQLKENQCMVVSPETSTQVKTFGKYMFAHRIYRLYVYIM